MTQKTKATLILFLIVIASMIGSFKIGFNKGVKAEDNLLFNHSEIK
jgi:hypothetical protein